MIVVINGASGVGKDTFVRLCNDLCPPRRIYNISTVDFVKQIAEQCGWEGTKTPNDRKFLHELKGLLTNWKDVPYKETIKLAKVFAGQMQDLDYDDDEWIVFIHCREPEEIQKFVERDNALTLCIRRDCIENNNLVNVGDENIYKYSYNYYINNNGDFDELKLEAIKFIKRVAPKLARKLKYGNSNNSSV